MLKKLFLSFFFFVSLQSTSFAAQILVENIFSDITENYEYRDELQALYDRGMIIPDSSWKFNPNEYLNRDEFVGIAMEVICERCILPHTEYKFIEKYFWQDIYFDVESSNRYFYCIAEADDKNYVRGYDLWESCQNGSSQIWERPFCPLNRINLEEAVAVLLRNSGIFTISDNQQVISDIYAGVLTETLWNDVNPTDLDGNPYTFYGYIQKALTYEITEYDFQWNESTLRLLETDNAWNINPQKSVTKEEFLKMSYIALKSNNCSETEDNGLALKMHIWEKECSVWESDCTKSNLNDPNDTYDFEPEVEWVCEWGIEDPTWYIWRFQNLTNGEQEIIYGPYIDDYTLRSEWEWRVYLRVVDRCGNTSEVYSTIFVSYNDPERNENDYILDVTILADPIYGYEDLLVNFEGEVSGGSGPYIYDWNFGDGETDLWEIVDHLFDNDGVYTVELIVTDSNGKTGSATVVIIVLEADSCLEDTDGDGIFDCEDACPILLGPIENSWCPILEISCDVNCGCPNWYSCTDSDPLTCGSWICKPDFDPNPSCLFNPWEGSIFGSALCTTCPCNTYLDFIADIRKCDLVFPAITSPDGTEIYSRWDTWQIR